MPPLSCAILVAMITAAAPADVESDEPLLVPVLTFSSFAFETNWDFLWEIGEEEESDDEDQDEVPPSRRPTQSGSEFSGENVSLTDNVVQDCSTLRRSATVASMPRRQASRLGAQQAGEQDDQEPPQQFDLGCQVFDGTGLWLAPDGIECNYADADVDGVCSAGFCVGKLDLSSTLSYYATDEPTNMLIQPTIPSEGTAERERVDSEIKLTLAKLLTAAFASSKLSLGRTESPGGGVEEDDELQALPAASMCDIAITGIDSTGLSGQAPAVFYATVDYTITVGPSETDHDVVAEALAAAAAAIKNPRLSGFTSDALTVTLGADTAEVHRSTLGQSADFGFTLSSGNVERRD